MASYITDQPLRGAMTSLGQTLTRCMMAGPDQDAEPQRGWTTAPRCGMLAQDASKEQRMGMGFLSSMEPQDLDNALLCEFRDPVERFTQAAVDVGLIRPGDKLDRNVIELCLRVVDIAAQIGDGYRVPACPEDTVGTYIRADLYE